MLEKSSPREMNHAGSSVAKWHGRPARGTTRKMRVPLLPNRLHRRCLSCRQLHRILQLGHDFGDAAFELWIATGNLCRRLVLNLDVRIDAVAFNDVLAFGISQR